MDTLLTTSIWAKKQKLSQNSLYWSSFSSFYITYLRSVFSYFSTKYEHCFLAIHSFKAMFGTTICAALAAPIKYCSITVNPFFFLLLLPLIDMWGAAGAVFDSPALATVEAKTGRSPTKHGCSFRYLSDEVNTTSASHDYLYCEATFLCPLSSKWHPSLARLGHHKGYWRLQLVIILKIKKRCESTGVEGMIKI